MPTRRRYSYTALCMEYTSSRPPGKVPRNVAGDISGQPALVVITSLECPAWFLSPHLRDTVRVRYKNRFVRTSTSHSRLLS